MGLPSWLVVVSMSTRPECLKVVQQYPVPNLSCQAEASSLAEVLASLDAEDEVPSKAPSDKDALGIVMFRHDVRWPDKPTAAAPVQR